MASLIKNKDLDTLINEDPQELLGRSNRSLRKERQRLLEYLVTIQPETERYRAVLDRIKVIEQIRTMRTTAHMNILKTVGTVGLTGLGLYATYKIGDNSDQPINRETKSLWSKLFGIK